MAADDTYLGLRGNKELASPGEDFIDIDAEKHDTNALSQVIRAFRVGTTAGDVKVVTYNGTTHTCRDVQRGEQVNCAITQVFATGTEAGGIDGRV